MSLIAASTVPKPLPDPVLDVRPLLHFRPDSVWLGESRMVLTHSAALGELRNELIKALGVERARGVLIRTGFTAGRCDAEMLRRTAPERPVEELLHLGPRLHGLEGLVRARITSASIDVARGHFHAEGVWENSWEDEQHSPGMTTGEGPACWNQIGYVSGFTSGLFGSLVIAREIQCMSQGDAQCALVMQDVASFSDPEYLRYFRQDPGDTRISTLETEVAELRAALALPRADAGLIGTSRAFSDARALLAKAAPTRITVLLLGETGTGKEMFARWLHENGPRADQPFVAVNCAAIPGELIESELFGVERGAYTGAQQPRTGRFERAHGGTLFLDEVGELAPQAQAKLLRVLQLGEVERLGGERVRKVDVRIVAATHVDLQQAVRERSFRADLYYRLNTFPIEIPALRNRAQDLPALAELFVGRYSLQYGKYIAGLSDRAWDALRRHDWPGNVRELENVIERAVLLAADGGNIELAHLASDLRRVTAADHRLDHHGHVQSADDGAIDELCRRLLASSLDLDQLTTTLLQTAVQQSDGNLAAAARRLGISRPQLAYRLKQIGRSEEPADDGGS